MMVASRYEVRSNILKLDSHRRGLRRYGRRFESHPPACRAGAEGDEVSDRLLEAVLICVAFAIVTVVVRFLSGETDRLSRIFAIGLWAISSAGAVAIMRKAPR